MGTTLQFKPDALIVGAAKSGTTSLYAWLVQHPDIYNAKKKEPKFFSYIAGINKLNGSLDQRTVESKIKTLKSYSDFYKPKKGMLAIDGSVENLYYHKEVIPLIKKYLGDIRIIICLRDPIARAFSAYAMQIRDQRETLSFKDALEKEPERIQNNFEFIWYYKSAGLYYNQVKAYLDNFTKVQIVIQDDLKNNPSEVVSKALNFLEVKNNHDLDFSVSRNKTLVPKNGFLYKKIILSSAFRKFTNVVFSKKIRRFVRVNFIDKIIGYKSISYNKECSQELLHFFKEDVNKLSNLLDVNLYDLWLRKYEE